MPPKCNCSGMDAMGQDGRVRNFISGLVRGLLDTRWLALVFVLCALPTGLGLALLTPMSEMPDEPAHAVRADGLIYGQIMGRTDPSNVYAGVMMNAGVIQAALAELWPSFPEKPLTAAARQHARAIPWTDRVIFWPSNMVQYFPALYLPGTLGLLLGQLAHMQPLYALFLGRVSMLASFLAMGVAALRLARFGRPLLFGVLMLPMTLYLAGSLNQDGQIIGAVVLAAALLTRGGAGRSWAWFLALGLLTLVMCSKPPYACLLLACLLPLGAPGLARRLSFVLLSAAMPALWLYLMLRHSFTPWVRPAYHPGPLWPGAHDVWLSTTSNHDNMLVLLAHPAQMLLLPLQFLDSGWQVTWRRIIGVFGWGDLPLQGWQYTGWVIALAAVLLGSLAGARGQRRALDAGFVLALLAASYFGIALSLYITWTNVGQASIDGINGRYFLLFPPFLVLVLPGLGERLKNISKINGVDGILEAASCLPAVLMASLDIHGLPAIILQTYKMTGP